MYNPNNKATVSPNNIKYLPTFSGNKEVIKETLKCILFPAARLIPAKVKHINPSLPIGSTHAYETENKCLETTSINRSEEHTSELQSRFDLVCRLLLEKKKH